MRRRVWFIFGFVVALMMFGVSAARAASPSLSASLTSVGSRGSVSASWSNVGNPTSMDWIGVYVPGAANSAYGNWVYDDSCTQSAGSTALASGSCTVTMPSTPGTYELRLFANNSYTLLATSQQITVAAAAGPSWITYHHDAARSGIDPDSSSPVAPTQVWQTPAVDGPIYGQPLVYGSHLYVATENDTVYALDSATGATVWQKHLATAVPAGQMPCGDINPTVGITSTPVIDPATGRIYVVGDTWDGSSSSSIKHELFGLNLSDGSPAGPAIVVDPPSSIPADQLQRVSLALDSGKVIIGYGGNAGDCASYHGWLVAAPEAGGGLQTFEVDSGAGDNQGAIWASGNAPAIDPAGNIWVSTGNGSSTSFDYQESVIKLDSSLNVLDWWAPSNWAALDSSDTDLGSSMPFLLPAGLVFQIGKAGVGYLLSAARLGHTAGTPVYSHSVCNGSWGGGIYVSGVIYVACADGMHAEALNVASGSFASVSGWTVNTNAVGPPIFAGGLVWSAGWGNGVLYGLDPNTGTTKFQANLGAFEHFASPSAGGGLLFVANGSQVTGFRIASGGA